MASERIWSYEQGLHLIIYMYNATGAGGLHVD